MKNKALYIIIAVIIATGLFYFGYSFNPNLKNVNFSSTANARAVSMLIDDGTKITGYKNLTIPTDSTVFGLLQNVATTNNITLSFDPASSNSFNSVFIKQIGDKKNGQAGSYWQYWVNGDQPQVGADHYTLTGGETVLWTFRPSAM